MNEKESTEYRVMWWSEEFGKWFPHAPPTDNPEIAQAWLAQAQYRGGRNGPVPTALESRTVTSWTPDARGTDPIQESA